MNNLTNWSKKRRLAFESLETREMLSADGLVVPTSVCDCDSSTQIVVDSASDTTANDGVTSLREAIAAAVAGDTIVFDSSVFSSSSVSISLSSALTIDKAISIDASSLGHNVTIKGAASYGVFNVTAANSADSLVTLKNLTLSNAKSALTVGADSYVAVYSTDFTSNTISRNTTLFGAGVNNSGNLSTYDCTWTSNSAYCGGAVYNAGTMTIADGSFSSNKLAQTSSSRKSTLGASIYNVGTVVVTDATFDSETSIYCAGSVYNSGASASFTMTGGKFTYCTASSGSSSSTASYFGGAIMNVDGASISLTDVDADNCSATTSGGFLYSVGSGSVTISGGTIAKCFVDKAHGGAIYTESALTVDGTTFDSNIAGDSSVTKIGSIADGGAIALFGSAASTIKNAVFTNNTSKTYGGAVAVDGTDTVEVVDCSFSSNGARLNGGAFYVASGSTATVSGGSFTSNARASGNWNCGGAMSVAGTLEATDVNFSNNYCSQFGGAVVVENTGDATFNQCAFDSNDAPYHGGAIYIRGGEVTLNGGSFTNNFTVPSTYLSSGGAIYVGVTTAGEIGTLTANDVTFSDNTATNYGGAIADYGNVVISGESSFDGNTAKLGGAVYCSYSSKFTAKGTADAFTTFSNNSATCNDSGKYGSGGAVYLSAKSASGADSSNMADGSFEYSVFTNNTADKYGGAIAAYGHLAAIDATFVGNQARTGGAMLVTGLAELGSCTFSQNKAVLGETVISSNSTYGSDYGGNGGAIYMSNNGSTGFEAATYLYGDVSFDSNAAENFSGAIDLLSGSLVLGYPLFESNVQFNNNVVASDLTTTTPGEEPSDLQYVGLGGAMTIVGDVSALGVVNFTFNGNKAAIGSGVVCTGLSTSERSEAVRTLLGFDADVSKDLFDPFIRYTTTNCSQKLTYEFLEQTIDLPCNGQIVVTYGDNTVTLAPGDSVTYGSLGISANMTAAQIEYYFDDPSRGIFTLAVELQSGSRVNMIRTVDRDDCFSGVARYNLTSYNAGAIQKWELSWGDGTTTTYEALGYDWIACHMYDNPTDGQTFDLSLRIMYVDSSDWVDLGVVTQYVYNAEPDDASAAILDEEESVFDSIFDDPDLVDELFV